MITFHLPSGEAVVPDDLAACPELAPRAVWIDLLRPTRPEELAVEKALAVEVPTREEMQQLELSRRLYVENDTLFMTATVITGSDSSRPESSVITFILTHDRLVTVRYADPRAFQRFAANHATPVTLFEGLVDALAGRLADILESTGAMVEDLSQDVFRMPDRAAGSGGSPPAQRRYDDVLLKIGRASDLVARSRESLVSLGRLVAFFRESRKEDKASRATVEHLATVAGDFAALGDYATFLSGKASFLLDATLGMISNEQNAIIKLVSVFALVFGPPTLIASIYGMNFEHMPELHWRLAYPLTLLIMVLSAIFPYAYFKRRGWL